MPLNEACEIFTKAAVQQCGDDTEINCNGLLTCKNPDELERSDVEACVTKMKNAANCESMKEVACSIACTEK